MTDAEELAVLREFAEKMSKDWTCMGDFYVGNVATDPWVARRIDETLHGRGVSFKDDSILASGLPLAQCILAARAKLQSERDAKDAPRLLEENERMRQENEKYQAALKEIIGFHFENPAEVCKVSVNIAKKALTGVSP